MMGLRSCPLERPLASIEIPQNDCLLGRVRPHRARTESRFPYSQNPNHHVTTRPTLDSGVRR